MKKQLAYSALALTLALGACEEHKTGTMETKKVCVSDSLAKMIKIDTVKVSPVKDELSLTGQISFDENKVVKVFPFSSGQVTDVKVTLGDKVTQGQVLAVVRSADVAGDYTDLNSAKADLAISKRQLEQAEYLYKNGISSERDYTEAKENYAKAKAANTKVQQQIAINGGGNTNANGTLIIRAPRAGYVVEKNIAAGDFIRQDNSGSLFTISDMKDVWVNANVFESDIAKVKEGYNARVTTIAYPDKIFNGKVDLVNSTLDPDSKVMTIRIKLPNNDMLLKPQMFTNVVITNNEPATAVALPASSIIFDNGKNYVVVYNNRCSLEAREVSPVKTVDSVTYVAGGVKAGERIITKNQLMLYNALIEE